jgi:hypothetical protein
MLRINICSDSGRETTMFANHRSHTRSYLLIAGALALGLALSACNGGGTGTTDTNALRDRVTMIEQRLDNIDAMLADALQTTDAETQATIEEAQAELDETRAVLNDMRAQLEPPPADPVDPGAPTAPGAPADPAAPAPGGF